MHHKGTKWFVYILECFDKTLYTGITNNVEKRINAHNIGKGSKYTMNRVPVILYYLEESENRSTASKREYQIKKMTREQKLKLKDQL